MNELVEGLRPAADSHAEKTAGMLLRSAREASGLHIGALAVAMKVSVKKLEALESDRLDLLPDAVFVRALASSVCRTLKVDSAPILAKLPQSAIPRLGSEQSQLNAPYYAPGHERQMAIPSALRKPSVLAVIVLLVAATILVFVPRSPSIDSGEAIGQVGTGNTSMAVESESGANTGKQSVAVEPPVSDGAVPAIAKVQSSSATEAVASNVVDRSIASSPQSGGTEVVTFKVRGTSWVEVTDAKGTVLLRKTLTTGESASTSGETPLSVVVGRTDVTDVLVRGQPFATDGISRDNVARFEVR